MFRAARRPVATLALLVVLGPSLVGCTSTQHVPILGTRGLDNITGVTTRSGRDISFAHAGAQIMYDTLYAVGRHGPVILPTDSIASVWDRRTSAVGTIGVVAGVLLVASLIAGAVAFGNTTATVH